MVGSSSRALLLRVSKDKCFIAVVTKIVFPKSPEFRVNIRGVAFFQMRSSVIHQLPFVQKFLDSPSWWMSWWTTIYALFLHIVKHAVNYWFSHFRQFIPLFCGQKDSKISPSCKIFLLVRRRKIRKIEEEEFQNFQQLGSLHYISRLKRPLSTASTKNKIGSFIITRTVPEKLKASGHQKTSVSRNPRADATAWSWENSSQLPAYVRARKSVNIRRPQGETSSIFARSCIVREKPPPRQPRRQLRDQDDSPSMLRWEDLLMQTRNW